MFDFKEWLRNGLINGYKDGSFSQPHVVTMTANYISKGMLTVEDASIIDSECLAWDEYLKEQEEIQNGEEIDPGFTHPGETSEEVVTDG